MENTASGGKLPNGFEVLPDYAVFKPVRQVTLREAVNLVSMALSCARANALSRILIDIRGLTGFESPRLPERYFFIREWAEAAAGQVKLAMVAPPEMIDPEKFGVTVALNAGMISNIFSSEREAVTWLMHV